MIKNPHIIMGKAGTAKSSSTYSEAIKKYKPEEILWLTGSNALKREAMIRFPGIRVSTIAGGAFITKKGEWYSDFKDLEGIKCIIFDEPFIANTEKIIEFCELNRDKMEIYILGDDKQMLVPHIGHHYLRLFEEFCRKPYVELTRLTRTYRTTHNGIEDTKLTAVYDDAYDNVDNIKVSMYDKYEKAFPHITYSDLLKRGFNPDDYYITYTNEAEESLYIDFDVKNNAYLEFVPKGSIASKDEIDNLESYPIACQAQAERLKLSSYLQAKNIGTITRMQGREVPTGHNCYIIVPTHCRMTNRAFYTAITRCWSYDSIIFVDYENPKTSRLKSFMGQPIKKWGVKAVLENIPITDGYITKQIVEKYVAHQDTDDIIWRRDRLRINGELYYIDLYKDSEPTTKSTAKNIIKKSPELNFNAIDEVYKNIGHLFVFPITIQNTTKSSFKYQLDLFSAYPHIIADGLLPVAGRVYDKMYPDKLNFYEVIKSSVLEEGSIITHQLAALLIANTDTEVKFVFGTDCEIGCKAGRELLKKAYKSVEDKEDTKGVHWGLYQRPYLESVNITYHGTQTHGADTQTEHYIVRNPENVYEPLFCAIRCTMLYILFALKLKLYGRISPNDGFMLVDALYLNEDRTEDIKNFFNNGIGLDYFDDIKHYKCDYRIYQSDDWHKDKEEYIKVYQSYEDLKTRKQIKNHKYYESHKNK